MISKMTHSQIKNTGSKEPNTPEYEMEGENREKDQRRRSQRLQLPLLVEVGYGPEDKRKEHLASTVNISADGALIKCGQSFEPGLAVQLRIHGPGGSQFPALENNKKSPAEQVVLNLSAYVVRVEENPRIESEFLTAVSFFGSGRVELK